MKGHKASCQLIVPATNDVDAILAECLSILLERGLQCTLDDQSAGAPFVKQEVERQFMNHELDTDVIDSLERLNM